MSERVTANGTHPQSRNAKCNRSGTSVAGIPLLWEELMKAYHKLNPMEKELLCVLFAAFENLLFSARFHSGSSCTASKWMCP